MKTSYHTIAKREITRNQTLPWPLKRNQEARERLLKYSTMPHEGLEKLSLNYQSGRCEAPERLSLCCGPGQSEALEDHAHDPKPHHNLLRIMFIQNITNLTTIKWDQKHL